MKRHAGVASRPAPPLVARGRALVVIAAFAIVVSILGLWSRYLAFDTDTYGRHRRPGRPGPEVRHAVSVFVAGRALEATDPEARLGNTLPGDAEGLATHPARQLRDFLVDEPALFDHAARRTRAGGPRNATS